jgi:hypothetical protein
MENPDACAVNFLGNGRGNYAKPGSLVLTVY